MVAIAVITGTIWFGISYGSPCAPLPPPQQQGMLYPEPLPSNIVVFLTYSNFPQLWCPEGEYSQFGQVGCHEAIGGQNPANIYLACQGRVLQS